MDIGGLVAMTDEELNKQDPKDSQSEVIRAIEDADLAIDRIRENFSLIFGPLEDRAHEWVDNCELVQPSSFQDHRGGDSGATNATSLKGKASLACGARGDTVGDRGKRRQYYEGRCAAGGCTFNVVPQTTVLGR